MATFLSVSSADGSYLRQWVLPFSWSWSCAIVLCIWHYLGPFASKNPLHLATNGEKCL